MSRADGTGPFAGSDGGLPLAEARLLNGACDAFEAKWRAGGRPDVWAAALELPESLRPAAVRELIQLDAYYRRGHGESPAAADYDGLFPELDAAWLAAAVADTRAGRGPPVSANARQPGTQLGPFGDYLLLAEVGRGGMGVVYEAVQEALGRHVALKVLPASATGDPGRSERFRREARAAARLHHTNIVPVFQTGEVDGVHFYAMQFIVGPGLDRVITQLRRLRGGETTEVAAPVAPHPATFTHPQAEAAACSLLTGRFEPGRAPDTDTFDPRPDGGVAGPPAPTGATSPTSPLATAGPAFASATGRRYWEGVARLGVQAAGALAHAHAQGVLHRDIKPGNLLLDAHGVLWVTDFGLAKTAEDEDLTAAGDILGTLRYMSPERFEGHCDARADVYALGLTLYELLTLRPAFDETGREKLIAQVTQGQPVRPSQVNPRIPRDLETVVLKAIARDPGARYQSAAELGEDLECFIQGRPILARRAGAAERLVRWSRRNPVVAGLTGALGAVLIAAAVGSAVAALSYRDLAEQESNARGDAEKEKRKLADDLERQSQANALFESGLGHAVRKEWAQALASYSRAAGLKPENSQVWSDRGGLLLKLGLADEAAVDFAQLFEVRHPEEPSWWHAHAALRLHVGDLAGYRAVCRDVRRHFPEASSPEVVRAVVQVCTLAPDGCGDPRALVQFIDGAAERFPTEYFNELRVAALFRADMHFEVVEATNPANPKAAAEMAQRPALLCFRAMSLARLNNAATAQASLAAARNKLDASASVLAQMPFGPGAGQRFVGTFPPAENQEATIDWVVDDLIWREAVARVAPEYGPHPLPLFVRARGCAALGWWGKADAATAASAAICLADPKKPRIADVALFERARLSATRGRWPEVAKDIAGAAAAARADYPLAPHVIALYTAYGRHAEARAHLSEAIAVGPKDASQKPAAYGLLLQRGRASAALKDWDAAAADLNTILSAESWPAERMNDRRGVGGGFRPAYFPNRFRLPGSAERPFDLRSEVREEVARHDEFYPRMAAARPDDPELRQARGRFLIAAKRWDQARDFYLDWVATGPRGNQNPRPQLVGAYDPSPAEVATYWVGDRKGADRAPTLAMISSDVAPWDVLFEPIAAKYPQSVSLWHARYRWLVLAKDVEKAADAITRLLPPVAGPTNLDSPLNAHYHAVVENEEVFHVIAARRPKDADLWMTWVREKLRHNEREKAEQAIVQALKRGVGNKWLAEIQIILAASPNPERTIGYCREALKLTPDEPELHLAHCLLNIRLKKWDDAVAAFEAALRNAAPLGTLRITAESVYHALPQDEETFAEFTRRRKDDGQLWLSRGILLLQSGKNANAVLARAAELPPKNPLLWQQLAHAYLSRRRLKEAAGAFDKVLRLLPKVPFYSTTPPEKGLEVYAAVVQKSFESNGKELFTALADLRPDDGRLWMEYSRALRARGLTPANREECVRALDEMVRRSPKEALAWVERGRYRLSLREVDAAAADFADAGKLLPRKFFVAGAWEQTWPLFFTIAQNPELFTAYTKLCPDDPFPWHFRAWERRDPSHPDHSTWETDLNRAIELNPDEDQHRADRRRHFLELGLWARAAALFAADSKREEPPVESVAWLEAASAYAAAGDFKRYRAFCRRMAEVWGEPESPVQRQRLALSQLLLPDPAADPRKMLAHAQASYQADKGAWWNTFTVALAHCRTGRPGEAIPKVRAYLKTFDGRLWGIQDRLALEFVLVIALARDGQKENAAAAFREACKAMDEFLHVNGKRKLAPYGHLWAINEVLRREADALLNNSIPPPRPVGG